MVAGVRCCYQCKLRTLSCHSNCEKYKKEVAEWERMKEIIKKAKMEANHDIFDRFKYWR